jgi:hypothetical protein
MAGYGEISKKIQTVEAEIIATSMPPPNDLESAIVQDLAPGNYTAIVRGVNGTTGIALVVKESTEVFSSEILARKTGSGSFRSLMRPCLFGKSAADHMRAKVAKVLLKRHPQQNFVSFTTGSTIG